MSTAPLWRFGPFCLDVASGCLWRDKTLVPLRPKPLTLLAYLVAHAGQVATKEMLFDAVWPDTVVSEGLLKDYVNQLRKALGDTPQTPQYIATVHRRGYRFMAPVLAVDEVPGAGAMPQPPLAPGDIPRQARSVVHNPTHILVTREAEVAQLQQWWMQACQGHRQIVCLTGEAGIGKTALVDTFVTQIVTTEDVWFGHGQCIEQYGAGEAYLPLLAALGRLGRGLEGERLVALLRQQAPSWLVHLPALMSDTDAETLQRYSGKITRERMLRELAEAVETLTVTRPLLLVLEDLHWSDSATMEWLAYVARRRDIARLLVLGTYRPVEAMVRRHPVRSVMRELGLHGQGVELAIGYLPEAGVTTYLTQRFGAGKLPAALASGLHQRTSGNPLFLVTVVDELVRQGVVQESGAGWEFAGALEAITGSIPESLRQLIEQQLEQLSPKEQELLQVASAVGREFAAAAVAAAVTQPMSVVEDRCEVLVHRGQFLRVRGTEEWADGTVSTCYEFLHDLYRETCYERSLLSRRIHWHRQIGTRLETGYGPRARDLAAELATHFVRGRDAERAVPYLQYAGENALRRSAHQEAIDHLTTGLKLLTTLPETSECLQQELDLQLALGPALIASKGPATPEVEQTYARARALCAQVGDTLQLFPTLRGLCRFYQSRGALWAARELGEKLYRLAQRAAVSTHLLEAYDALGMTLFYMGEYTAARTYSEQGIALADPTQQRALALHLDVAPGVRCLAFAAHTLWCLGYPAQALWWSQEALALAQALAHPFSLAFAQHWAAFLHHRRQEALAVQAQADALLSLATIQGFPHYVGLGTCWCGWALTIQGQDAAGLTQMHQGLAALLARGLEVSRPRWLVLLAEATAHVGQVEEGLRLLAEALKAFEASDHGDLLAEAYRLQGALLLRQTVPNVAQAEACFQQALSVARRQQAESWELRAAINLSWLWQHQGKRAEAWELLAPIYGWFTEGFDTADLQAARSLLAALQASGSRYTSKIEAVSSSPL